MRYVLSSWTGFEIDSSEFSVALETSDVAKTLKAFWSSSFIEKSGDSKHVYGLSSFYKVIEISNLDKPTFTEQDVDGEKICNFVERIKADSNSGQSLLKDDLLKLAEIIKKIRHQLPHLTYDLIPITVSFTRKNNDPDGTNTYTLSLTGEPYEYMLNWYNQEEFFAVLQSIRKKCGIGWKSR